MESSGIAIEKKKKREKVLVKRSEFEIDVGFVLELPNDKKCSDDDGSRDMCHYIHKVYVRLCVCLFALRKGSVGRSHLFAHNRTRFYNISFSHKNATEIILCDPFAHRVRFIILLYTESASCCRC